MVESKEESIGDDSPVNYGRSSVIIKYDSNVSIERIIEEQGVVTSDKLSVSVPSVGDEQISPKALLQSQKHLAKEVVDTESAQKKSV